MAAVLFSQPALPPGGANREGETVQDGFPQVQREGGWGLIREVDIVQVPGEGSVNCLFPATDLFPYPFRGPTWVDHSGYVIG